ncbi:MAG: histidine phosphatase family protein [Erysipelotrichaceae bacterium]|nr:histidine phosphatase family protein [Erysipelotrichaceae bacterium]
MKTVRFYYVRHGQTVFNLTSKAQGWSDSPLTPLGVSQAEETAERLRSIRFDRCYCSDFTRARETCEPIMKYHDCPVIYHKGLREMNFGTMEGEFYNSMTATGERISWRKRDFTSMLGENRQIFDERIVETINEIYDQAADGERILLVGHRGYCMEILEYMLHLDPVKYDDLCIQRGMERVPNGAAMIFECTDGRYSLIQLPGLEDVDFTYLLNN